MELIRSKLCLGTFTLVLLSYMVNTASAMTVYFNDFESASPDLSGWTWENKPSPNYYLTVVQAPNGQKFLGKHIVSDHGFVSDEVTLRLDVLDPHASVTVFFDLYVINHWEGNGGPGSQYPDLWEFQIDGIRQTYTTFSTKSTFKQSYPSDYVDPPIQNNYGTGSDASGTLGYLYDYTYKMEYDYAHSASTLDLKFIGDLSGGNGKWGLDNVTVISTVVPIPGAVWLLGSGLISLVGIRRRGCGNPDSSEKI